MARVFLVTANVGSVYDNMEHGLQPWLNEFISVVGSKDPEFVAIHFQETGGKGTENVNESAQVFVRQLVSRMEEIKFRVAEGFVDTQAELEDQYTALSSIYFVHESLRLPVHIWDFQDSKFYEVFPTPTSSSLSSIHIGKGLEQTNRKQKEKFPQHFYPNCKWSRKGFLRTRWRFGKTIMDFVNIHLFHDSCNLMAASTFPSPFAQLREKTVKYTLERILNDGLEKCPLFIFGDFNFRINGYEVMNILRKDFSDLPESEIVLGTKRFHCPEQELRFKHNYEWLKQYDFESKQFPGLLLEQDLKFHPTYPFEEDVSKPEQFMRTRLPAWCDRVLFTPQTKDILDKDFPIEYSVIGSKVCMGDHKPVTLHLKIKTDDRPPSSSALNSTNQPGSQIPFDQYNRSKGKHNFPNETLETLTDLPSLVACSSSPPPEANNGFEEINRSIVIASNDGLNSPPHSCNCFQFSWPWFRGKMRNGGGRSSGYNGRCNNNGGDGSSSSTSFFGLKNFTRRSKRPTSGFGSLLEPMMSLSLPSSGQSSQRPSISGEKNSNNPECNCNYFPVLSNTNGATRFGWKSCTNCNNGSMQPVLANCEPACANNACPNRLLMMNLTSVINSKNGLNSSNLSLINTNSDAEMKKNHSGENKICWTNMNMNCSECEYIMNNMNCKNLKNQSKHNHSHNHNHNHLRGRSASQGSASIQALKCKCREVKEGMAASRQGRKGGCLNCSKCVIL